MHKPDGWSIKIEVGLVQRWLQVQANATINGYLELALLKGRQRFDTISTLNLEVYKFWDWWIFTQFIFEHSESLPSLIWSTVNLWMNVHFIDLLCCLFESESWPRKNKSAWWIFTQLYFCSGESWPNCYRKKVKWWWILTYRFCWKGENRWKLEVGRFKMPFDVCISVINKLSFLLMVYYKRSKLKLF